MTHQEIVQAFVTKRLEDMADHTGMWGSNEAVEAQAIILMEVEFLSKAPEILEENPRIVLDEYVKILHEDHWVSGNLPLHHCTPSHEFGKALLTVCTHTRERLAKKILHIRLGKTFDADRYSSGE